MNTKEMLDILRLLSVLESWAMADKNTSLPDYLHDQINTCQDRLEHYILEKTT